MTGRVEMRLLTVGFAIFWAVYWALSGMDKFLAGKTFGSFTWYGGDYNAIFGDAFINLGLRADSVTHAIIMTGIWQLLIALPFVLTIIEILSEKSQGKIQEQGAAMVSNNFYLGLVLSLITFTALVMFHIISGNQSGLMIDGLFIIILAATYGVSKLEEMVEYMSHAHEHERSNLRRMDQKWKQQVQHGSLWIDENPPR